MSTNTLHPPSLPCARVRAVGTRSAQAALPWRLRIGAAVGRAAPVYPPPLCRRVVMRGYAGAQAVLGMLSTFAIITNSALFGFTSNSLYYYFPTMTEVGARPCQLARRALGERPGRPTVSAAPSCRRMRRVKVDPRSIARPSLGVKMQHGCAGAVSINYYYYFYYYYYYYYYYCYCYYYYYYI